MRGTVIRPDVPEGFDPGDLCLVRTAEERDQINAGIDRYTSEQPEDGEQCIQCLRYTYDPHYGQCMNCGFQMHPEED